MKRRKKRKKILIPFAFVLLFSCVIALALYQNQEPREITSAEYFKIVSGAVDDGEFLDGGSYENSSVLMIYGLTFTLEAVMGDAHDVVIRGWVNTLVYPDEHFSVIRKGEKRTVMIMAQRPFGYRAIKDENGRFPVRIYIACREAKGYITFSVL